MTLTPDATIVVVDDDESMRTFLSETLESGGYGCRPFPNGAAALNWLASGGGSAKGAARLLLSDINMPGMSGLDLLRTVKTVVPALPVILISGRCDLPLAQGALKAGATDYLLKPVMPADLLSLVSRHLGTLQSELLETVRAALKGPFGQRGGSANCQTDPLRPLFNALGFKRFETLQHSRRVAAFALLIARGLELDAEAVSALETGSLLHDIGKGGIPHNVIMKAGKLNDREWEIVRMHPQLGLDMLSGLPGFNAEAEIVYSHHERFDGGGYPNKLMGEAIPLSARVFSVADTLDAMTSDRCYRGAQGVSAARREIHRGAGSQFDPAILRHFDCVTDDEIESVHRQFPDVS